MNSGKTAKRIRVDSCLVSATQCLSSPQAVRQRSQGQPSQGYLLLYPCAALELVLMTSIPELPELARKALNVGQSEGTGPSQDL